MLIKMHLFKDEVKDVPDAVAQNLIKQGQATRVDTESVSESKPKEETKSVKPKSNKAMRNAPSNK